MRATAPFPAAATAALMLATSGPAFAQSAIDPNDFVSTDLAVLRALDKQMGRMREFTVAVGDTMRFYGLEVTVRTCQTTPVSTTPHQAAFLEIRDDSSWADTVHKVGDDPDAPVFSGWMFADSPSLSGLEHPVYDLWLKECTFRPKETVQQALVLPTRKPER